MDLLEATQHLLRTRLDGGVTIPEIVRAANGDIGREWLYKFAAGSIPNPGVVSIQTLHDCLKTLKKTAS